VSPQPSRDAVSAQVARLLKKERIKQGLSMSVLAERAGLSQPMVSYVEREMRKPTLDTLLRLSDAMGIDLVDVLRQAKLTAVNRMAK
jgi:transcriptional regulator with XRE-family HTH domain